MNRHPHLPVVGEGDRRLPTWSEEVSLQGKVEVALRREFCPEGRVSHVLTVSYPENAFFKQPNLLPASYYATLLREMVTPLKTKRGYSRSSFTAVPVEHYSSMVKPYIVFHVAHRKGDRSHSLRPSRQTFSPFRWEMTFVARFEGELTDRTLCGITGSTLSVLGLPFAEELKRDLCIHSSRPGSDTLLHREWLF